MVLSSLQVRRTLLNIVSIVSILSSGILRVLTATIGLNFSSSLQKISCSSSSIFLLNFLSSYCVVVFLSRSKKCSLF